MSTLHTARRRPGTRVALACERPGDYEAGHDPDRDDDATVGPGLRDQISELARQARMVAALAADDDQAAIGGGELAGLLEILTVVDLANAAAVDLTIRARAHGRSERAAGLPLEQLLAFRSKTTYPDRRTLLNIAETLPTLPRIRSAFQTGALGWAQVRVIVAEVRHLDLRQRARLDAGFDDPARLQRLDPDVLVDEVRAAVDRLRPDLHENREVRKVERRYLHAQPDLDGGIRGHFELPGEDGTLLLEALHAAAPPPSAGPDDHTRHAPGHAATDHEQDPETPDGLPAFTDPVVNRSLARRRADGLTTLAQHYLAGHPGDATSSAPHDADHAGHPATRTEDDVDGDASVSTIQGYRPAGRARPSMHIVADINQLTGNDAAAQAARTLMATHAGRMRLTPKAVRRLAENARLRFLLTDRGEVLGISSPTKDIPASVRAAVEARDQGCRFPGCAAPIHFADLHHVIFREHGGPTTVDNLVALCRRHHTAVHQGGWKLSMTPDGAVTCKRGRQRHTTDPPLLRALLPRGP